MAEYRLSYKRGKSGYANSHAAYILREHKYQYKEDLIYKEYGNLPKFSGNNALDFWYAADEFEGINRNAYREFELNIPNELNHQEAINLIKDFVTKEIGENFPYTFAIHESFNKETGEKNLHCHLMFSERKLDNIEREKEVFFKKANTKNPSLGGAKKDRIWKSKERLLQLRKSWEILQNSSLEKNGFSERVDCRSLAERRKEALEQGDLNKAESLERDAINLSGKVMRKMEIMGYNKLSQEEKKQVDNFNQAKKLKKEKERKLNIRKGKIIPKEFEIIERLDEINKFDEGAIKRLTLNILTKGELNQNYYELRRVERALITAPTSKILLKKKSNLESKIREIADTHVLSYKYNRITEQLKRDLAREKEMHLENLKNVYKKEYTVSKKDFDEEKTKNIAIKLRGKYTKKDTLELMYKLEELNLVSSNYKATQILTNYKLESLTKSSLRYKEELKAKNNALINARLFSNELSIKVLENDIKELNSKLEKNTLESNNILNELNKKHSLEELDKLTNLIENNTSIEKSVINEILENRLAKRDSLPTFEHHRTLIIDNINLMTDLEKNKKLYTYFIEKNNPEKYGKSIYLTGVKIEVISNIINTRYNEVKGINIVDKNTIFNEIRAKEKNNIAILNDREIRVKTAITNITELLSSDPVRNNLTSIDLITINKISEGKFSFNYRIIESLEEKKQDLEKQFNSSNFLKKPFIMKEIKTKEKELSTYYELERKIIEISKNNKSFNQEKEKITLDFTKSLSKLEKDLKIINSEKSLSFKKLQIIKEIEERKYIKEKDIKLSINPIRKLYNTHKFKELSYNLNEVLQTHEERGYNNLEIKLEKERSISL